MRLPVALQRQEELRDSVLSVRAGAKRYHPMKRA